MRKGKKGGEVYEMVGMRLSLYFTLLFFSSSCVVRLGLGLKIQLSVYNCLDK